LPWRVSPSYILLRPLASDTFPCQAPAPSPLHRTHMLALEQLFFFKYLPKGKGNFPLFRLPVKLPPVLVGTTSWPWLSSSFLRRPFFLQGLPLSNLAFAICMRPSSRVGGSTPCELTFASLCKEVTGQTTPGRPGSSGLVYGGALPEAGHSTAPRLHCTLEVHFTRQVL